MPPSQSFPGNQPSSTSSTPKPADSAPETSLSLQRVILLYEALPATLVASSCCAFALVIVNWNALPHDRLLAWLAYQLILSAGW